MSWYATLIFQPGGNNAIQQSYFSKIRTRLNLWHYGTALINNSIDKKTYGSLQFVNFHATMRGDHTNAPPTVAEELSFAVSALQVYNSTTMTNNQHNKAQMYITTTRQQNTNISIQEIPEQYQAIRKLRLLEQW